MKKTKWDEVEIKLDNGQLVSAIAPIIISASRNTDIPAFYADWFRNRLEAGYCVWLNPNNQERQYVSFAKARAIVFWSKNPAPLLKHLPYLDSKGLAYYFQFTLNDYDDEKFEPGIPPLEQRIALFKKLSNQLGRIRVVWRFDPLIISNRTPPERLIEKVVRVGEEIHEYTERLVISFVDIKKYPSAGKRLRTADIGAREFMEDEMKAFASGLTARIGKWNLDIRTCAESVDLSAYGIRPNKCVDNDLLTKWFSHDAMLIEFLKKYNLRSRNCAKCLIRKLKDKGQRKECGCIDSKDIGMQNTCPYLCLSCYAYKSYSEFEKNRAKHIDDAESIA